MIKIKCYFENGDAIISKINGTIQDAEKYYVGKVFNIGSVADNLQKCIKIEVLEA
jgi:ribosomal protein L21E